MKRNFNLLSEKELLRRKLTLKAIEDFYGERLKPDHFDKIVKAIKNNSTLGLDDDDKHAVWCIKTNLADSIYCKSLQAPTIADSKIPEIIVA